MTKVPRDAELPAESQADVYSLAELMAIAKRLVTDHRDVVVSAGPTKDLTGVGVHLTTAAPADTLAALQAETEVPVRCDGIGDPMPL